MIQAPSPPGVVFSYFSKNEKSLELPDMTITLIVKLSGAILQHSLSQLPL